MNDIVNALKQGAQESKKFKEQLFEENDILCSINTFEAEYLILNALGKASGINVETVETPMGAELRVSMFGEHIFDIIPAGDGIQQSAKWSKNNGVLALRFSKTITVGDGVIEKCNQYNMEKPQKFIHQGNLLEVYYDIYFENGCNCKEFMHQVTSFVNSVQAIEPKKIKTIH